MVVSRGTGMSMKSQPLHCNGKIDVKSLDFDGFSKFMDGLGEPHFRTISIYKAIWKKGVKRFIDIPRASQATLKRLDKLAHIDFLSCNKVIDSDDGSHFRSSPSTSQYSLNPKKSG